MMSYKQSKDRDFAIAIEHLSASLTRLAEIFEPGSGKWYHSTSSPQIPGPNDPPPLMQLLFRLVKGFEAHVQKRDDP